jgi:hypothetical protein
VERGGGEQRCGEEAREVKRVGEEENSGERRKIRNVGFEKERRRWKSNGP